MIKKITLKPDEALDLIRLIDLEVTVASLPTPFEWSAPHFVEAFEHLQKELLDVLRRERHSALGVDYDD
jgi:hypothetical protein